MTRVLKALSHPSRLRLLDALAGGSYSVGGLAEHVGLHQSVVSQNLQVLRHAGLVSGCRDCPRVNYGLTPAAGALVHCCDKLAECVSARASETASHVDGDLLDR